MTVPSDLWLIIVRLLVRLKLEVPSELCVNEKPPPEPCVKLVVPSELWLMIELPTVLLWLVIPFEL